MMTFKNMMTPEHYDKLFNTYRGIDKVMDLRDFMRRFARDSDDNIKVFKVHDDGAISINVFACAGEFIASICIPDVELRIFGRKTEFEIMLEFMDLLAAIDLMIEDLGVDHPASKSAVTLMDDVKLYIGFAMLKFNKLSHEARTEIILNAEKNMERWGYMRESVAAIVLGTYMSLDNKKSHK